MPILYSASLTGYVMKDHTLRALSRRNVLFFFFQTLQTKRMKMLVRSDFSGELCEKDFVPCLFSFICSHFIFLIYMCVCIDFFLEGNSCISLKYTLRLSFDFINSEKTVFK